MGTGIASALGRRMRSIEGQVRLIAPVGAAAGLAAAFNSPIAAVLFVIEEVIGKQRMVRDHQGGARVGWPPRGRAE